MPLGSSSVRLAGFSREVVVKQFIICVVASLFFGQVAVAGSPSDNMIETGQGPLTIHPTEHATFVMQWNDKTIAVDPIGGAAPFDMAAEGSETRTGKP